MEGGGVVEDRDLDPKSVQVPDIIVWSDEAAKALINTKVPRPRKLTDEEKKQAIERLQKRLERIRKERNKTDDEGL